MEKAKEFENTINTIWTNEQYKELVEFNKALDNAQSGVKNDKIRTTSGI